MKVCYNNFIFLSDISNILKKTPNEEDLFSLVYTVSDKWYDIGISLQVRRDVLDDLRQSEDDNLTKLSKVINIWKDTKSSSVTWEKIISVMEDPVIDKREIADGIRQNLKASELSLLSIRFFINTVTVNF